MRPRANGHSNEINVKKILVLSYLVVGNGEQLQKCSSPDAGTVMFFAIGGAASQSLQSSSSTDSSVAGWAGREQG